ncbi:hypothetical protein [Prosthecobacter sp.]|jgi:hypothetical protein|uniref:hypothetical protein n=1 Tax=Prosthecobacter sp. TaxID=1965333 RepID=UPI0025FFB6FD|nr:hypothetical protein [Prosthecobacter sp.]
MRLHYYCMSHLGLPLESFMGVHPLLKGDSWVTEDLSIGDVGLRPPKHTMEDRLSSLDWMTPDLESEWGIDNLRQYEDLASLFEVAGDGDGHRYYLSTVSRQFYVWWRFGPQRVTPCNLGSDNFIDWLVEQYPEQPKGRSWTTFAALGEPESVKLPNGEETRIRLGNTSGFSCAHNTCFPLAEIEALASEVLSDPVVYRNEESYSALDPARPLLIEAFHNHRGFYTHMHLSANNRAIADKDFVARVVSFQKSLLAAGFCHPDSRELSRIPSDFL